MNQPDGAAVRVFVSHSWKDKPLARRVAWRLEQSGAEVFLDEAELRAGQMLTARLREEIRRTTHLVVVWTAAAATSAWVRQEVEFATGLGEGGPIIVPLLLEPPGADSIVSDHIGIEYANVHRFEQAFTRLAAAVFAAEPAEPAPAFPGARPPGVSATPQNQNRAGPPEERLARDLARALDETPAIRRLFRNPVTELHEKILPALQAESGIIVPEAVLREKALPELTAVFHAWRPEDVSVVGLPVAGEADYHALDFAMWCAARIVLDRWERGEPRLPIELAKYPGTFAKVFGATRAGYEALLLLLGNQPGLASDALIELVHPGDVADANLAAAVELFEATFALTRPLRARDQFTPYGAALGFLQYNLKRLSPEQKQAFLRLIEDHEDGPGTGASLDILGALAADPALAPYAIRRVRIWVETGRFDRTDDATRSALPLYFYGFVASCLKAGLAGEARDLLSAARERIRKLFRSCDAASLVSALAWLADADRLSLDERGFIGRAYQDGVFSSEFEQCLHHTAIAPLARLLFEAVTREQDIDEAVRMHVSARLRDAQLPDTFV